MVLKDGRVFVYDDEHPTGYSPSLEDSEDLLDTSVS